MRTQKLAGPKGCEICIIVTDHGIGLARTVAVQDFIEYGRRDMGRPERDINRGMLPPKVAQILLNLAQVKKSDTILDPFCGTGTVLQEALLMGARLVIGRDNDSRAIQQSEENLQWLKSRDHDIGGEWQVYAHDASEADESIKIASLDAVVTEPYLGPLRPPHQPEAQAQLINQLCQLYKQALQQSVILLKPKSRVALVVPVIGQWSAADQLQNIAGLKLMPMLSDELARIFGVSDSRVIVYRRPEQVVGRAVMVFEKI